MKQKMKVARTPNAVRGPTMPPTMTLVFVEFEELGV